MANKICQHKKNMKEKIFRIINRFKNVYNKIFKGKNVKLLTSGKNEENNVIDNKSASFSKDNRKLKIEELYKRIRKNDIELNKLNDEEIESIIKIMENEKQAQKEKILQKMKK